MKQSDFPQPLYGYKMSAVLGEQVCRVKGGIPTILIVNMLIFAYSALFEQFLFGGFKKCSARNFNMIESDSTLFFRWESLSVLGIK